MCLVISGGGGRGGGGGTGCMGVVEIPSCAFLFCGSCTFLDDFRLRRFPLDVVGEMWYRR